MYCTTFYKTFWLILAMQPICFIAYIFDGAFKGMGEMKYLRNVLLFSTGCVFIPVLFMLDYFGYKLYVIWIAYGFWMTTRGILLLLKFRRKFLPLVQKQ